MKPWRVGRHYNIHVYEDDRPVATFFRSEDAAAAVAEHNACIFSSTSVPVDDAPNGAIGKTIEWVMKDAPKGAEIDVTGPGGQKFTLRVRPVSS
jgi:hypothetical protein